METITYNLRQENGNYFNDIQLLGDTVVEYFTNNFDFFYRDYSAYILNNGIEELRTFEEYIYDLLSAGVYINTYSAYSEYAPFITLKLQKKLYLLRRRKPNLKPFIDPLRGIFSTLFLSGQSNRKTNRVYDFNDLNRLILWMEATGEFREETKRLLIISGYLKTKSSEYRNTFFKLLNRFTLWFQSAGEGFLKNYTSEVKTFLTKKHRSYKWKENYIFTGRKSIEYHLSMVGADLMNRAYRQQFLTKETRALLLPACMREKQNGECRAKQNYFDMTCSGCSKNCEINKLTLSGKENNFSVHIIPHSSDFTSWLKTWAINSGIGVIGVACPLNLLTGGLELKSLNISAQCIPLDYCGCKNHWHKTGLSTKINETELFRILDNSSISRVVNF
ncbi:MAG: DUF116 domain-containing protein [Bacteroidetes bacterium]|nr:DUF116 domain-containing protein [Bacteroidota bacterium]